MTEKVTKKRTKSKGPGILPDDPMAEAGRKVLRFHFRRMLKHEPGTREGTDIEALHDMRVATRRMRAAFRVFGDFFQREAIRKHRRGLRRTAAALGAVRDLDVFIAWMEEYLDASPAEERTALQPLLEAWKKRRRSARKKMIAYLDSKAYRRFVERFGRFLATPGAGAVSPGGDTVVPFQVRHVAPAQIWQRYASVRAYETVLSSDSDPEAMLSVPIEVLHALRIECKRLRYTLEFFREVLPAEAEPLIAQVVRVQDHLGDLHDADVAIDLMRDFIRRRERKARRSHRTADVLGAQHFLEVNREKRTHLLRTFPELWRELSGPVFRDQLARVVSAM